LVEKQSFRKNYFKSIIVLTKDSVSVTVDAVMYYRVFDPTKSVTQVTDAKYSSSLLAGKE
jgi:regulator of protease activity HflC (stomatin/prohibitin superfamily)